MKIKPMKQRLMIIIGFILLCLQLLKAQEKVNIWQGTACRKNVEMTAYLAKGGSKMAAIVCPGGSYLWHDMNGEGHEVGKWLQNNGISAFVLHYRTAGFMAFFLHYRHLFRGVRYPDALDDLTQATLYIKEHAKEYGVCSDSIGAMGFSAGGHLVLSGVTLRQLPLMFVAPIYPVVTMNGKYVHKRSRRALLGDNRKNNRRLRDSLSVERHISDSCPPVFLVNCKDDPIVKYQNSELLDSALTVHHIPHQYIQYKTGGHGFGASDTKGSPECRQWKKEFLAWIRKLQTQ